MDLLSLLPFLKSLGNVLKNLFLGAFLYKKGKESKQLENLEKESKDVQESKKMANHIRNLPTDRLRKLLASKGSKSK